MRSRSTTAKMPVQSSRLVLVMKSGVLSIMRSFAEQAKRGPGVATITGSLARQSENGTPVAAFDRSPDPSVAVSKRHGPHLTVRAEHDVCLEGTHRRQAECTQNCTHPSSNVR